MRRRDERREDGGEEEGEADHDRDVRAARGAPRHVADGQPRVADLGHRGGRVADLGGGELVQVDAPEAVAGLPREGEEDEERARRDEEDDEPLDRLLPPRERLVVGDEAERDGRVLLLLLRADDREEARELERALGGRVLLEVEALRVEEVHERPLLGARRLVAQRGAVGVLELLVWRQPAEVRRAAVQERADGHRREPDGAHDRLGPLVPAAPMAAEDEAAVPVRPVSANALTTLDASSR